MEWNINGSGEWIIAVVSPENEARDLFCVESIYEKETKRSRNVPKSDIRPLTSEFNPVFEANSLSESAIILGRILADKAVDINELHCGESPLMKACYEKNFELVNLLISRGANPKRLEAKKFLSPFQILCHNYYWRFRSMDDAYKIIELLFEKFMDINEPDDDGKTPIEKAIELPDNKLLKKFLSKGAVKSEKL